MTLKEILEQELNREWTEEEKQRAKELIDNYEYSHCEMLDGFELILPTEDNMSKELEIMKYIESEMIRVNDECGRLHFDCDLRLWQDKQLELETIERIYEELNSKFFNGKL